MINDPPRPVRVLYLAGSGRSGSTVVTNILGQLPGTFAGGELRYLWQRGVQLDHLCGCGQPFSTCPVWVAVMQRVRASGALTARPAAGEVATSGRPPEADGTGHDEPAIASRLLRRLRIARLPGALARKAVGRRAVREHPDDVVIASLYRAIAEETGADIIIDGSKLPPYGLLLQEQPGLEVFIVHLVRDPRATAFSWLRTKPSRDTAQGAQMQRQETWKSALLWTVWNLTAAWLWRADAPRVTRLRYEDLIADPVGQLSAVVLMVGGEPDKLPFLGPDRVQLGPTHSVAGNPNRHDTGVVQLRADDQWRNAMSRTDRAVVTLITALGLRWFGYPLRTRTSRRPPAARPKRTARAQSASRAH